MFRKYENDQDTKQTGYRSVLTDNFDILCGLMIARKRKGLGVAP